MYTVNKMTKNLRPNQPTTRTAETQLTALLGRLQAAERVIDNADPMDVDALTKAYAEKSALERAVQHVRDQLTAEARQAQTDAIAARETAEEERRAQARTALLAALRPVVKAVQTLENAIANYAAVEVQHGGDIVAGPLPALRGACEQARRHWAVVEPELLGLKQATAADLAREHAAERHHQLAAAEARLVELRKQAKLSRETGAKDDWKRVLRQAAHAVHGQRVSLYCEQDPAEETVTRFLRAADGLPEIAEWAGAMVDDWRIRQANAARSAV